jgi:hypothetical protein
VTGIVLSVGDGELLGFFARGMYRINLGSGYGRDGRRRPLV